MPLRPAVPGLNVQVGNQYYYQHHEHHHYAPYCTPEAKGVDYEREVASRSPGMFLPMQGYPYVPMMGMQPGMFQQPHQSFHHHHFHHLAQEQYRALSPDKVQPERFAQFVNTQAGNDSERG